MERKEIEGFPFVRYVTPAITENVMVEKSRAYFEWMNSRRSVRDFSAAPIPLDVIKHIIHAASTAPSGAHKQPWTFCVISNAEVKRKIREAAEQEEYESYHSRMSEEWLKAIRPLQTDWHKPFLETAPYIIAVFKQVFGMDEQAHRVNNYYVNESVGLACGFLLAAIHNAGLVALTHTPSPMNFLSKILNRPDNERPYLLIPVGYPAEETFVPDLKRKSLEEVMVHYS